MSPQPKAVPLPALLVFGKPTNSNVPQVSWFRVEDRLAVKTAARSLKLAVVDLTTDADQALLADVHEGVLKANGRLVVGSVAPEVYRRIEERFGNAEAAARRETGEGAGAEAKTRPEQTTNVDSGTAAEPAAATALQRAFEGKTATSAPPSTTKPTAEPARDPWDALRVGAHVVGKYWEEDGEPYGWWIGVINDVVGDHFIIRWPDEPLKPGLKIERKHVAILHPSFDVNREWDRRR